MADLSKLKVRRNSSLGSPPPLEEASINLEAPELAPASVPGPMTGSEYVRVDGRTARKSHRTKQFATRVSQDWDERIRQIAARDGLLLVEVLERALDAYEGKR